MPRPERVRIGALEYGVEWDDPEDGDRYGECDIVAQVIRVSGKIPGDRQREGLLHEVLHAVADRYLADEIDERVVRQLAAGLLDWMVANLDAMRWIVEEK